MWDIIIIPNSQVVTSTIVAKYLPQWHVNTYRLVRDIPIDENGQQLTDQLSCRVVLWPVGDRNVLAVEIQQVGVFLAWWGAVQDGIEET